MIMDFGRNVTEQALNDYTKIDLSETNIDSFCEQLELVDWKILNDIQDVNEMYDTFLSLYKEMYDKCFPIVNIQHKNTNTHNPWLTKEIKALIRRKNILYRKYVKNPTSYRHDIYKCCRNIVNKMIRKEKRAYYKVKFENAKDNIKKTWNVINGVLNKKNTKKDITDIEVNDENVLDKQEIVNIFNDYFISIGQKCKRI